MLRGMRENRVSMQSARQPTSTRRQSPTLPKVNSMRATLPR
jgi:hypothetical protein